MSRRSVWMEILPVLFLVYTFVLADGLLKIHDGLWIRRGAGIPVPATRRLPGCKEVEFFLVDGLSYNVAVESDLSIRRDVFPRLSVLADEGHLSVTTAKAIGSYPTYTTNRLASMFSSGTSRTCDLFLAFLPLAFRIDDAIFRHLDELHFRAYGDDTISKLYKEYIESSDVAYSFDISDKDTVDNIVYKHLRDEEHTRDRIFRYYHFLGYDHIRHSTKTLTEESLDRLRTYDHAIRERIDRRPWCGTCCYIITADHGMTPAGTHGGATQEEIEIPLILVLPRALEMQELSKILTGEVPQAFVGSLVRCLFGDKTFCQRSLVFDEERTMAEMLTGLMQNVCIIITMALIAHAMAQVCVKRANARQISENIASLTVLLIINVADTFIKLECEIIIGIVCVLLALEVTVRTVYRQENSTPVMAIALANGLVRLTVGKVMLRVAGIRSLTRLSMNLLPQTLQTATGCVVYVLILLLIYGACMHDTHTQLLETLVHALVALCFRGHTLFIPIYFDRLAFSTAALVTKAAGMLLQDTVKGVIWRLRKALHRIYCSAHWYQRLDERITAPKPPQSVHAISILVTTRR